MNINGTLLALQMMNGAKVYEVKYLDVNTSKTYSYKSEVELEKGDVVIVPRTNTVSLATVVGENEDVDFDATYALKWIVGRVDGVWDTMKANAADDARAKAKLVKSKAQTAAKEYLAASGLDVSDVLGITSDEPVGEYVQEKVPRALEKSDMIPGRVFQCVHTGLDGDFDSGSRYKVGSAGYMFDEVGAGWPHAKTGKMPDSTFVRVIRVDE